MPLLELKSVAKGYGSGPTRAEVLEDSYRQSEEGDVWASVGYSGAGKTTFISMIAGLIRPDEG